MELKKRRRFSRNEIIAIFALFLFAFNCVLVSIGVIVLDLTPTTITFAPEEFETAVDPVYLKDGEESIKPAVIARAEAEAKAKVEAAASDHGNTSSSPAPPANHGGVIYLTFDDGPGAYTAELLDILQRNGVKATFFVTGAGDDSLIAREYNEGHSVGLHTFSHNYQYIYSSVDNFLADLIKVQDRVKNITGYTSYLMRFPGGSSNTVSRKYDNGTRIMSTLTREVENRGFTYFDWNVVSGDAGGTTNTNVVYSNVVNALKPGGSSVVLQHDIKGFSVAAVERIIQYGKANGYTFSRLEPSSFTAHHGVNN